MSMLSSSLALLRTSRGPALRQSSLRLYAAAAPTEASSAKKQKGAAKPAAAAPPANAKAKAPEKPHDPLSLEPALGVNRAYDEAMKWFGGLRAAAQERVDRGVKEIESIQAAKATLSSNAAPAGQIEELEKNLDRVEGQVKRDREWLWRNDPAREKKARFLLENLDAPSVETMTNEQWAAFKADSRLRHMGKYWGLFDDVLLGNPFTPSINLVAKYGDALVQRGAELAPALTKERPTIKFGTDEKDVFYTLLLVDADEPNPKEKRLEESVHWLVTNIPGRRAASDVSKGTTVLDYIPPHPSRGSSFHRFVFVLFEQKGREVQVASPPTRGDRFRPTAAFMAQHGLKPVAFAFFRAQWDATVSAVYRDVLQQAEPVWGQPASEQQRGRAQ